MGWGGGGEVRDGGGRRGRSWIKRPSQNNIKSGNIQSDQMEYCKPKQSPLLVCSSQNVKQPHDARNVKHLIVLSLKNEQWFQTMYNEVSNHWQCWRPPLLKFFTFSSCFSLYLTNSVPTASCYLELYRNYVMNCTNTLPSGGISSVALRSYLCRSHAILAKLVMFTHSEHIYYMIFVPSPGRV